MGLLLAAGASRRFGPADKLLAPLRERPLLRYAADAMRTVPLDRRIAVIVNPALRGLLSGFEVINISQGQQSDSLRAGLLAAGTPDRLLVALGDMPDVTADHLMRVLGLATNLLASCSHDGIAPLPPACFPRSDLASLSDLDGDQGAGRLLWDLPEHQYVHAPELLRDIDLPNQIVRATSTKRGATGGAGGRDVPPLRRGTQWLSQNFGNRLGRDIHDLVCLFAGQA